jgi:hypothetical protein
MPGGDGGFGPQRTVAQSVNDLQMSQARFQRLSVVLRGSQVYLSGAVAHWDDVQELAAAIAHLPAIDRVLIGDVRIAP